MAITVSAKPLPPTLYKYLEKAERSLKQLADRLGDRTSIVHNDDTRRIMDDLQQAFEAEGPTWAALLPRYGALAWRRAQRRRPLTSARGTSAVVPPTGYGALVRSASDPTCSSTSSRATQRKGAKDALDFCG